jgi:hypothetical protein
MPGASNPPPIPELQDEIETFIRARGHPIVVEGDAEIFDLSAASWRLTVQFDKLLFEVWNPARSIVRRIDEVAYRDREKLGLFVHKPGGRGTATLEIREMHPLTRRTPHDARSSYRHLLLAMLEREYPGWKFERVSHRSDREHSFSTHYTRGLARRGTTAWAFLGLSPEEPPAAADGLLAHGIIWLDWWRSRAERFTACGLKLFVPRAQVDLVAHRAAYLHPGALQTEILAWKPGDAKPSAVDLRDYGNVATRLAPRRQAEELLIRHAPLIRELLGEYGPHVDIVPGTGSNTLSLRVLGLEVARIEGLLAPKVFFGLEGSLRRLSAEERDEFRDFLGRVNQIRRADSGDPTDEFYRLQSERWLESLLVRDITRVDPALRAEFVYPQVPAFTGQSRGVIDILTVTRRGRLAVVELKLDEDINLPLQGLDYWLRVRWLQERGRFQEFGYFPGVELSPDPPLLYLVSPAFRFHSTSDRVIRYLAPSVEVIKVGVNQQWRRRVEVLFRRSRSER